MAKTFSRGYYTPRNPTKYKGDISKIEFRSSWELSFNKFLDHNVSILEWSSEPFAIPYFKRITGRVHKYFPDYYIKYINKNGDTIQEIIEVKPKKQCAPSKSRNKRTKAYEDLAYSVNEDKWKAARQFCAQQNIKFRILTEEEIFK